VLRLDKTVELRGRAGRRKKKNGAAAMCRCRLLLGKLVAAFVHTFNHRGRKPYYPSPASRPTAVARSRSLSEKWTADHHGLLAGHCRVAHLQINAVVTLVRGNKRGVGSGNLLRGSARRFVGGGMVGGGALTVNIGTDHVLSRPAGRSVWRRMWDEMVPDVQSTVVRFGTSGGGARMFAALGQTSVLPPPPIRSVLQSGYFQNFRHGVW